MPAYATAQEAQQNERLQRQIDALHLLCRGGTVIPGGLQEGDPLLSRVRRGDEERRGREHDPVFVRVGLLGRPEM